MISKIVVVSLFFIAFLLTCYLTDLYLKSNFYERGEAYMKGAGHLLQEDFLKGIIFLTTRHFFASTFLFCIPFSSTNISNKKILLKQFAIMALLIAGLAFTYTLIKLPDLLNNDYNNQQNKLIETILPWLLWVAGFYAAYRLIKKLKTLSGTDYIS